MSVKEDVEGNVVIGFSNNNILMLDCDGKEEEEVITFAREYAKFHDLGSALVIKTSETKQLSLNLRPLANYCIIFGRVLSWEEIKWHIQEAYRLGMVDEKFAEMRNYSNLITIRVNAKNKEKPPPEFVHYFHNGDDTGIIEFLRFWSICKELGRKDDKNVNGQTRILLRAVQ